MNKIVFQTNVISWSSSSKANLINVIGTLYVSLCFQSVLKVAGVRIASNTQGASLSFEPATYLYHGSNYHLYDLSQFLCNTSQQDLIKYSVHYVFVFFSLSPSLSLDLINVNLVSCEFLSRGEGYIQDSWGTFDKAICQLVRHTSARVRRLASAVVFVNFQNNRQ